MTATTETNSAHENKAQIIGMQYEDVHGMTGFNWADAYPVIDPQTHEVLDVLQLGDNMDDYNLVDVTPDGIKQRECASDALIVK